MECGLSTARKGKFPPSNCVLLVPVLNLPAGEQWSGPLPCCGTQGLWLCGQQDGHSNQLGFITCAGIPVMASPSTRQAFSVHYLMGSLDWLEPCCSPVGNPCLCSLQQPLGRAGSSARGASCASRAHATCLWASANQKPEGEVDLDLQVCQSWH